MPKVRYGLNTNTNTVQDTPVTFGTTSIPAHPRHFGMLGTYAHQKYPGYGTGSTVYSTEDTPVILIVVYQISTRYQLPSFSYLPHAYHTSTHAATSGRELLLWFPKGKLNDDSANKPSTAGGGGPAAVGPGNPQYDELMSYMKEKVSLTKLFLQLRPASFLDLVTAKVASYYYCSSIRPNLV